MSVVMPCVWWGLQMWATPWFEHPAEEFYQAATRGPSLDFLLSIPEAGILEVRVTNRGSAADVLRELEYCPPGDLALYRARGEAVGEFLHEAGSQGPILLRITREDPQHELGAFCSPTSRVALPFGPRKALEPGGEALARFRFSPPWSAVTDREDEVPSAWGFCSFTLKGERSQRLKLMRCGNEPVTQLEPMTAEEIP